MLESHEDKSKGYDPVVYVATFLFGFASGGATMADFERLNDEPGLKRFLGIRRFPDETTLGQWMRAIGDPGAKALMRINREFIAWATQRIKAERLLHGGQLDECEALLKLHRNPKTQHKKPRPASARASLRSGLMNSTYSLRFSGAKDWGSLKQRPVFSRQIPRKTS